MLKKQTVWLLTMLSLMIVLSVYYMSSPEGGDFAYVNQDAEGNEQSSATEDTELELGDITDMEMEGNATEETSEQAKDAEGNELNLDTEEGMVTSSTSTADQLFASIRMEREDERNKLKEQLDDIIASSSASSTEMNEAYEEMKQLESMKTKEFIIEETLKSEGDYQDVLVRADGEDVVITVKTEQELSGEEANRIMQLASDEFGQVNIEVESQPIG